MTSFSLFEKGITITSPSREISIQEFLDIIKQDKPLVDKIRKEADKDKRQELKRKLGYVTIAGTFRKRGKNDLIKSSGLACLDIDDLKEGELQSLKDKLSKNPFTHLLFISPSGNGLKLIVKIPEVQNDEEYKKYWLSILAHYNLSDFDEANKDISRACYLSVDKDPYFNPDSTLYTYQVELQLVKTSPVLTTSRIKKSNKNYNPKENVFLEKLKARVSMASLLSYFGVDTSQNPTNCPFHTCSQSCLSFNQDTAHCFDTDCSSDNSWNILSFVQKIKNLDSAESIKWLSDYAGMQKEYELDQEDYRNNQKEPRGWACSISIVKWAGEDNLKNCFICNKPLTFTDKLGWWKCSGCGLKGGLKEFAGLVLQKKKKEAVTQ